MNPDQTEAAGVEGLPRAPAVSGREDGLKTLRSEATHPYLDECSHNDADHVLEEGVCGDEEVDEVALPVQAGVGHPGGTAWGPCSGRRGRR